MRDINVEQRLDLDSWWAKVHLVQVPSGKQVGENKIAVMQAITEGRPIYLGFYEEDEVEGVRLEYLRSRVEHLNGQFGVRVRRHAFWCYILTTTLSVRGSQNGLNLKQVGLTTIDDPTYPDLPVYSWR